MPQHINAKSAEKVQNGGKYTSAKNRGMVNEDIIQMTENTLSDSVVNAVLAFSRCFISFHNIINVMMAVNR